jgi:putative restriction endonuclease
MVITEPFCQRVATSFKDTFIPIHLIGIDPDYHLHVSGRLLELKDGPMLEALKGLDGQKIHLPRRVKDQPDRDRLALRFELFKTAA